MIVPRSRLIAWTALITVPLAIVAAADPDLLAVAVGGVVLFLLLAALDAGLAHRSLDGLTLELPQVTRMAKNRPGQLEIRVRNEPRKGRAIRVGLPFPPDVSSPHDDMTVLLPEADLLSQFQWPCTPRKRGLFQFNRAYLEAVSPLGFWAARLSKPTRSELRVYPNLREDRKQLAALFLHRGSLGLHAQRQVGKGREFEKLRDYISGDSFDDVHWKATAKRGRPVTKVFQIERTQEIYVIIDTSRLSARPVATSELSRATSPSELQTSTLERFITSALVLGLAAEQQGDLFGLLTFSDKVQNFVRAKNGRQHYGLCRDVLYTIEPRMVTPDFHELATFIRLRLQRRALLVLLTSLDDPILAENFISSLVLVARQHLLLINMMNPGIAKPLFTNPNAASLDDIYQHLGGHLLWHDLRELGKTLQRRGAQFSLLEDERISAQLVSQYLAVKQRQLL
jgi:uncharacterized protein (DUF58 family)